MNTRVGRCALVMSSNPDESADTQWKLAVQFEQEWPENTAEGCIEVRGQQDARSRWSVAQRRLPRRSGRLLPALCFRQLLSKIPAAVPFRNGLLRQLGVLDMLNVWG